MSTENRIRHLEQRIANSPTTRECSCTGSEVTIDQHGAIICDSCRGLIPPGTPIHLPAGVVPAEPDEGVFRRTCSVNHF